MATPLTRDAQAAAYDQICEIARVNALIWQAGSGVVTIVHPDTQRAQDVYEHIQYVHGLGPHPDSIAEAKAKAQEPAQLDLLS